MLVVGDFSVLSCTRLNSVSEGWKPRDAPTDDESVDVVSPWRELLTQRADRNNAHLRRCWRPRGSWRAWWRGTRRWYRCRPACPGTLWQWRGTSHSCYASELKSFPAPACPPPSVGLRERDSWYWLCQRSDQLPSCRQDCRPRLISVTASASFLWINWLAPSGRPGHESSVETEDRRGLTELFPVHHVVPGRLDTELRGPQWAPGNPISRVVQTGEGTFEAPHVGQHVLLGHLLKRHGYK